MAGNPRFVLVIGWLALAGLLLGQLGPTQAAPLREGGPSSDPSPTATMVPPTIAPMLDEPGVSPDLDQEAGSDVAVVDPSDPHTRPRGESRDYDNPAQIDEETGAVTIAGDGDAAVTGELETPAAPRLGEPVLRWLPEIVAAAEAWGIPAELVAGMMRLESTGEPGVISPVGARGLMQVMPDNLIRMGFPEAMWHDPASNAMAGARMLAEGTVAQGSLAGSVQAYFGFGCDIYGTCTDVYVQVAFGWADYYRPIIADPTAFGLAVLPADWSFGPIVLYQVPAPPIEEPPPPPTPVPDDATATPSPSPTRTPRAEPTRPGDPPIPTEPPVDPATEVPTDVPTIEAPPTEVPTAIPTDVPTEVPTEVPTAIPTEPPPVDPPADPPADDTG